MFFCFHSSSGQKNFHYYDQYGYKPILYLSKALTLSNQSRFAKPPESSLKQKADILPQVQLWAFSLA